MMKSSEFCEVEEPKVRRCPEPLCSGDGPFRANVAALVIRPLGENYRILLGERSDTHGYWQWPQGGMEPGEDHLSALRRELAEEIGLTRYTVRYRFPFRLRYRFPESYVTNSNRPHIGQEQTYFVVEPLEDPDLSQAGDDEFRDMRWFPIEEATGKAVWFKTPLYKRVMKHAKEILGVTGNGTR